MVRLRAIVLAAAVAVLAAGCGRAGHGEALDRIGALVEEDAAAAASALDSLDRGVMDEAQGNYYDFLKLKSDDKRYEQHKSDSTIVRLLEYYRGTEMEAEVTYYAGRVYSDLGDYPTALRYFQDANEMTKGDEQKRALRSCITSQTGGLLNDMRLYREAIPYLVETIALDSALNCAKDLPLDNQLLGAVYMHLKEYEQAEGYFRKALSQATNEGDSALFQGYLAASKFQRGDYGGALKLIRGVTGKANPLDRDFLLSYAADIYLNVGSRDTAYMYALELSRSSNPKFNRSGYEILLRPELQGYTTMDSIGNYVKRFTNSMNEVFNEHGAQAAMMQNTMYNYALHEREKEQIASAKNRLQRWLLTAGIVVAILVFAAGWYKYRLAVKKVQLTRSENLLLTLEREHKETLTELSRLKDGVSVKEMFGRLVEQSRGIIESKKKYYEESAPYRKIVVALEQEKILALTDEVWDELDECIRKESETFDEIVSGDIRKSLSAMEYAVLLMIKAGFGSNDIGKALGRAKSSITYPRSQIRKKVFFDQIEKNDLVNAIRMF